MSSFVGTPDYQHGSTARLGVLLVNLGTPDAPTTSAVRRFLAQFLSDPRVIESPRWLWWLALHGAILRIRPRRSAHAYQQIWMREGSPLLVYSRQLATQIQSLLTSQAGTEIPLALGMTYGNPDLRSALASLKQSGVQRLLILPLFPQYSATSTGAVFDAIATELKRWRWIPETRFITQYHDDEQYIAAVAADIAKHREQHGPRHLLFSFHGIPKSYVLAGDPYHCQCQKSARLIAERLQLQPDEWTVGFQSRLGRQEWVGPYTEEILQRWGREGRKQITVVCPGFATDCLETLEEIALRNRDAFLEAGGEVFDYLPCLNAAQSHVEALCALIKRHCMGWPDSASDADRHASRERALALGALR
jgi:ferrochelatase